MIRILRDVIINIACAGRFLMFSNLLAPTYWETIEEMALLVCPKTQISIDINVVTIPIAAKDSVGFRFTFPITAASVSDKIGSDMPAINAGIASLFILFKLISVVKLLTLIKATNVGKSLIKYRSNKNYFIRGKQLFLFRANISAFSNTKVIE